MRYIFFVLIFFFISIPTAMANYYSDTIWLEKAGSKISASDGKGHGAKRGMHKAKEQQSGKASDEKKGKKKRRSPMSRPAEYKLKSGVFPDQAFNESFLGDSFCWLKMPDKSIQNLVPKLKENEFIVLDEALQAGFYQLYLYNNKGVKDGVRYQLFSTLWFRNSGEDDFEKKEFEEKDREGMFGNDPVFNLKELTVDTKNNFVSQKRFTGDKLPIQILMKGVPVSGAEVILSTKNGWSKKIISDHSGKAEFVLIKEIFHDDMIHKKPEPYMITASCEVEKNGNFKGLSYSKEVFVTTSQIMVYPTPLDWKSKSSGFYIVAGSTLVIMFAAAIRRKGRDII